MQAVNSVNHDHGANAGAGAGAGSDERAELPSSSALRVEDIVVTQLDCTKAKKNKTLAELLRLALKNMSEFDSYESKIMSLGLTFVVHRMGLWLLFKIDRGSPRGAASIQEKSSPGYSLPKIHVSVQYTQFYDAYACVLPVLFKSGLSEFKILAHPNSVTIATNVAGKAMVLFTNSLTEQQLCDLVKKINTALFTNHIVVGSQPEADIWYPSGEQRYCGYRIEYNVLGQYVGTNVLKKLRFSRQESAWLQPVFSARLDVLVEPFDLNCNVVTDFSVQFDKSKDPENSLFLLMHHFKMDAFEEHLYNQTNVQTDVWAYFKRYYQDGQAYDQLFDVKGPQAFFEVFLTPVSIYFKKQGSGNTAKLMLQGYPFLGVLYHGLFKPLVLGLIDRAPQSHVEVMCELVSKMKTGQYPVHPLKLAIHMIVAAWRAKDCIEHEYGRLIEAPDAVKSQVLQGLKNCFRDRIFECAEVNDSLLEAWVDDALSRYQASSVCLGAGAGAGSGAGSLSSTSVTAAPAMLEAHPVQVSEQPSSKVESAITASQAVLSGRAVAAILITLAVSATSFANAVLAFLPVVTFITSIAVGAGLVAAAIVIALIDRCLRQPAPSLPLGVYEKTVGRPMPAASAPAPVQVSGVAEHKAPPPPANAGPAVVG